MVLGLTVHHISLDGRSMRPFLRDLLVAYAARSGGHAPGWSPLPVDYVDYTLWKHASLGRFDDEFSRATGQLQYWANTLTGRPSPLVFPCDRPRPPVPDRTGATVAVSVDRHTHGQLLQCAQNAGASIFMVLQAAFALSVAEFARCADVTVATAVAGRDHPWLDDLVGNFSADVLMRIRLDRSRDAAELLHQVRRVSLAAFARADTPNHRLKRALPECPGHPVFQTTLVLQRDAVTYPARESGLSVTEVPIDVVHAKHDLEFGLTEHYDHFGIPAGISGSFVYPTALFDRRTSARFVTGFIATVQSLAAESWRVADQLRSLR